MPRGLTAGHRHLSWRRSSQQLDGLAADAGVALPVETDYLGTDFVDYFSIGRVEGRWWTSNKTYGHTA